MADDVSIELWLDRRKLSALERVLTDSGTDTQTVMQARLKELYMQYVPSLERAQINERIEAERLVAERHAEESRCVSAFCVTENGSREYFRTEKPYELLYAAKLLRNYLTKAPNASPSHFEEMFTPHTFITPDEYDELISVRMENTGKVAGAFDIDFDKREFSAVNTMDGWKTYAMGDISTAAYYAFRKDHLNMEQRWHRFLDKLDGKEITQPVTSPQTTFPFLRKSRRWMTGSIFTSRPTLMWMQSSTHLSARRRTMTGSTSTPTMT